METDRQNDDPPGVDDYEYTSESSNEEQEILDKFYNANEDTCNTVINTLESNPTWILPMYQYNEIEKDFTKQRPILEIDFLLDSGATINLLNEDTWNEIKYNNPDIRLEQANKTLTAANITTIETFRTVTINLTPDKTSNSRNKPQHKFSIHFYVTQCNHNILGTPFFKEYIETINVKTNKLTINTNTFMDNDITFFMNSTKGDKNEYHPISYEKYNTEAKTNLIPKYKPKTKIWQSPLVEKDNLIIERNQKAPYTIHHDDDYLRLINNIKTHKKHKKQITKV